MTNDQKDSLRSLLEKHGTLVALHALLKSRRDVDDKIRVSGTFDDLIKQVFDAHARRTFTDRELFDLLARCEENGRQHIFYYRPKDEDALSACADVAAIEAGLLGGKSAQQAGLPKTLLVPDGEVIADFRHETRPGTKYSRWIFKVYSGIERMEFVREEERSKTEIARIYRKYYAREIILAAWHSFGLLEIRRSVFTDMSLKTCRDELERSWVLLSKAIDKDAFEMMKLDKALKSLAREAIEGSNSHDFHNAEFQDDKDGRVTFNPKKHDDSLVASKSRRKAIEALQDCVTAVVTWKKPDGRPDLPDKLRTEISCFLPHEIRIGSQTTPEAVEYVGRRLFDLSK